jgi:hypothetical protein
LGPGRASRWRINILFDNRFAAIWSEGAVRHLGGSGLIKEFGWTTARTLNTILFKEALSFFDTGSGSSAIYSLVDFHIATTSSRTGAVMLFKAERFSLLCGSAASAEALKLFAVPSFWATAWWFIVKTEIASRGTKVCV